MQSGVPDVAAHMFIFYYAVLSEVAATALSAVCGGRHHGRESLPDDDADGKYTLPAFVVQFMFIAGADGRAWLPAGPGRYCVVASSTAHGRRGGCRRCSGWLRVFARRC